MQVSKILRQTVLAAAILGIGLTALSPAAKADDDRGERDHKNYKKVWSQPVRVYYPPVYHPPAPRYYYAPPPAPRYYYPPATGYKYLPQGYRRVVIRNRVFYTRDNRNYLGYSPSRQLYVILNPFSFF